MSRIIVIEDDIYLREELIHTFEKEGYQVASISSFPVQEQEILDSCPDLAVLDLNLPGKSGFELCRGLKARASFPILILTARDALADELSSLSLGADDFLTKPCHPKRLLARAERLLLTYGKMGNVIEAGELMLDLDTFKVTWKNTHIILPETEGKILKAMFERYPNLVSKQDLAAALWGGSEFVDENILQVNMTRLRKRLSAAGLEAVIGTVRGLGYRLEVEEL